MTSPLGYAKEKPRQRRGILPGGVDETDPSLSCAPLPDPKGAWGALDGLQRAGDRDTLAVGGISIAIMIRNWPGSQDGLDWVAGPFETAVSVTHSAGGARRNPLGIGFHSLSVPSLRFSPL